MVGTLTLWVMHVIPVFLGNAFSFLLPRIWGESIQVTIYLLFGLTSLIYTAVGCHQWRLNVLNKNPQDLNSDSDKELEMHAIKQSS
jgi:putative Ca2+/H+ antiporter (TMEM165/GDT1 family)